MGFDIVGALQRGYGSLDKNAFLGKLPGGASREAAEEVRQITGTPGAILQRGLIPITPIHSAQEGGLKFAKSFAGPLGMPFDIQPALTGRQEMYDREIAGATRVGDTLIYGDGQPGYRSPQGIIEQGERGITGQWVGDIDPKTGEVSLREGRNYQPYDTNQNRDWHLKDAAEKRAKGDHLGAFLSEHVYGNYAALQDAGWTNMAPQGTQKQVLGNINPKRMAGDVDITVSSTATPGPATNYAVQAGDTLTSIAADRGTTVAELVRRNNIANPDLIQIGQMIR